MSTKKTTEQFITDAQSVHDTKYNYSKVIYLGDGEKVSITCLKHGDFLQKASSHLQGNGCRKCVIESRKKNLSSVITDFEKIHGNKYDYSKLNYINAMTKVCIVCPKHGDFFQEPHSHLKGQGCPSCCTEWRMDTKEDFIKKSIESHGGVLLYDYSKVNYIDSYTKVCIICKKHGEFWQTPSIHLRGCGCTKCNKITLQDGTICDSKVEAYRYVFHKKSGIPFLHNKQYGKELGKMRYDFYFPTLNTYEEVTAFDLGRDAVGFNKIVKDGYIARIARKKKYVEDKGGIFRFLELELTKENYKELYSNVKFAK